MIEFVLCDDNERFLKKVEDVVINVMIKNDISYKTKTFIDYDDDFLSCVRERKLLRIYILDIETPNGSGIDMARLIRKRDIDSIIIFLTGHEELGETILKSNLLYLSFINKFDGFESKLADAINESLKYISVKKILRFKDSGIVYTISCNDILYITTDSVARKSIIKTDYSEFKVGKTLIELKSLLNNNFIQTHRACLVNKNRVTSINKKIITFDNGDSIDLVSSRFNLEEL